MINIMLKNKNCGKTIMLFMYKFAETINYIQQTVLERLFYFAAKTTTAGVGA